MVSLVLSDNYTREDYDAVSVGFLHKEAILGYTVMLLWIRQLRLLQVGRQTGAFYFMLGKMLRDVIRWAVPIRTSWAIFACKAQLQQHSEALNKASVTKNVREFLEQRSVTSLFGLLGRQASLDPSKHSLDNGF